MWVCLHCRANVEEDDWETCWKCGKARDTAASGYDEVQHEAEEMRRRLSRCPRCSGKMSYRGLREIPYDLVARHHETERFVLYGCDHCGKIEFFAADTGWDLRGDPESGPPPA